MEVRDILLALTTYPEATPVSAVDEAVAFAVALGARISAIACEVKIQAPGSILAGAVLDVAALAATEAKKSSTNAKNSSSCVPRRRGEARSLAGSDTGALPDVGSPRCARRICPTSGSHDCTRAGR